MLYYSKVAVSLLPSQPSSTNGLGTKACLMGSSKSPLVSKEAMQPWKPDLDSRGRGRFPYMFVLTPPEREFFLLSEIIIPEFIYRKIFSLFSL